MARSDLIARLAELHSQLFAKDTESVVKVILDTLHTGKGWAYKELRERVDLE